MFFNIFLLVRCISKLTTFELVFFLNGIDSISFYKSLVWSCEMHQMIHLCERIGDWMRVDNTDYSIQKHVICK